MVTFNTPSGISHIWNGSHTVQVFAPSGALIDAWTLFPSDGGKPSELDISLSVASRGEYVDCLFCGYWTLVNDVEEQYCDSCGIILLDEAPYARLAQRRAITCANEISDGNRDDPSYAYCNLPAAHAGDHRYSIG